MAYEIWRDDSMNLSASFETLDQALAALRCAIVEHGERDLVRQSSLVLVDRSGRRRTIAEGDQLVERASRPTQCPPHEWVAVATVVQGQGVTTTRRCLRCGAQTDTDSRRTRRRPAAGERAARTSRVGKVAAG